MKIDVWHAFLKILHNFETHLIDNSLICIAILNFHNFFGIQSNSSDKYTDFIVLSTMGGGINE